VAVSDLQSMHTADCRHSEHGRLAAAVFVVPLVAGRSGVAAGVLARVRPWRWALAAGDHDGAQVRTGTADDRRRNARYGGPATNAADV